MTEHPDRSTAVTILCSACSASNELEQHRAIECAKCDKPLTGKTYYSKARMPAILAFAVGVAGYSVVDRNVLDSNRYPLNVEYAMVNACTNGDLSALPRELYDSKQEICLCAVEKIVDDVPLSELKGGKAEFGQILAKGLDECW